MGEPVIEADRSAGPLDGRVAIVTGAGRGIGREEALELARLGALVVVNDLGTERNGSGVDALIADQLVAEMRAAGHQAVAHSGDVAEAAGAASLVRLAVDTWGRLDIVVNNAGILRDRTISRMTLDEWDSVIKVHLRGHFLMTQQACLHWRERVAAGERVRGRVINTTSTSGLVGNVGQANYAAAKAGIAALTQVASMEMARYGVSVNAIAPGARTRMTEGVFAEIPTEDGDPVGPEHVAKLVAFLATDAAEHVTGQVFRVRGGIIELYEGWRPVSGIESAAGWTVDALTQAVPALFGDRPTVYAPSMLPGQTSATAPPSR